jgi:hypothetical protein
VSRLQDPLERLPSGYYEQSMLRVSHQSYGPVPVLDIDKWKHSMIYCQKTIPATQGSGTEKDLSKACNNGWCITVQLLCWAFSNVGGIFSICFRNLLCSFCMIPVTEKDSIKVYDNGWSITVLDILHYWLYISYTQWFWCWSTTLLLDTYTTTKQEFINVCALIH